MKSRINAKHIWIAIAAIMLLVTIKRMLIKPEEPTIVSASAPFSTTFKQRISGIGIVEPKSKNIAISPSYPGIVAEVLVVSGQNVKAGQTLFIIEGKLLEAEIASAQIAVKKARHDLAFYSKAQDASSKQELVLKKYELATKASKLNELLVKKELLNVKSPIDATILKVNISLGQYASDINDDEPLLVLGDLSKMHVRVEIDETDVQRLKMQKKAVGALRSSANEIELEYVAQEYLLKEKKSLINDGSERVDARVLEVIYSFANEQVEAVPGQAMDVFIELEE